jgi:phospholipid/cholesterol/gamma-HCH transport system substrate-binding protein
LLHDDSLYTNLNEASRELDLLLEDLRLNPNRYLSIFGKKDRLPKLSNADIERIGKVIDEKK